MTDLTIPPNLRKSTDAVVPIAKQRKPRVTQQLPTTLVIEGDTVKLCDLSLEELAEQHKLLKAELAETPRLELLLKAVVAESVRKLKE